MTNNFETENLTGMFDTNDINNNKILAVLAYIPLLFLIPLLAANDSKFAKFHANQGLILTIFAFVCAIIDKMINFLIDWIPLIGGIISGTVSAVLGIAVLAYIIIGIVNTAQGNAKKLLFIGDLFEVIK